MSASDDAFREFHEKRSQRIEREMEQHAKKAADGLKQQFDSRAQHVEQELREHMDSPTRQPPRAEPQAPFSTLKHDDDPVERARLQSAGFDNAQIDQFFAMRGTATPSAGVHTITGSAAALPAPAAAQGAFSNVLSSIVAVVTYAGSTLAAIPSDFGAVFDHTLTSSRRAQAAASFAIKVTVVAVLGYAAWSEWQQHIISARIIAEQQAEKIEAEKKTAAAEAAANTAIAKGVPSPTVEELLPYVPGDTHSGQRVDEQRLKALQARIDAHQSTDAEVREYYELLRKKWKSP